MNRFLVIHPHYTKEIRSMDTLDALFDRVAAQVLQEYDAERRNPQPFRRLNAQELNAISTWVAREAIKPLDEYFTEALAHECRVSYRRHRGNFTVCTISLTYGHPVRGLSIEIRTGASRRHDKDKPNRVAGELEALKRAVTARPITIPV